MGGLSFFAEYKVNFLLCRGKRNHFFGVSAMSFERIIWRSAGCYAFLWQGSAGVSE